MQGRPSGRGGSFIMSFMEKRRTQITRHEIAGEIVCQLRAFETDLDRALASGSRLVGLLPDARARANVSGVVGQDAISHFVASIAFISQSMEKAAGGHLRLDATRRDLRIPEIAGGDKIPLPTIASTSDRTVENMPDAIAG